MPTRPFGQPSPDHWGLVRDVIVHDEMDVEFTRHGSFDLVVSRFSAHHWHDVARGLAEARRVLAPTGSAVLVDVVAPEEPLLDTFLQTIELLRDPSHVRDYAPSEWRALLEAAGFAIEGETARRLPLEFASWIARMKTQAIAKRAKESHGVTLTIDDAVIEAIAARCREVESGARNVDHILRGTVLPMVSSEILRGMASEAGLSDKMRLTLDKEGNIACESGT